MKLELLELQVVTMMAMIMILTVVDAIKVRVRKNKKCKKMVSSFKGFELKDLFTISFSIKGTKEKRARKLVSRWREAIYSGNIDFSKLCSVKKLMNTYVFLAKKGIFEEFKGIECLAFYVASEREVYEKYTKEEFYKIFKERVSDMNMEQARIDMEVKELCERNNKSREIQEREMLMTSMLEDNYDYYWDTESQTAVRVSKDIDEELNLDLGGFRRRSISENGFLGRNTDELNGLFGGSCEEDKDTVEESIAVIEALDCEVEAEIIEKNHVQKVYEYMTKSGRILYKEINGGTEYEVMYYKGEESSKKFKPRTINDVRFDFNTRMLMSF